MSNIQNIKYSDFFRNLTHIPPKGSDERKALIKQERERCLGGVYVDGVFISGWLYWHINFWWISDDIEDEHGNIIPVECIASLRDNEWLRADALERCRTNKNEEGKPDLKGYIEVGLRQGGKSTIESSFTAYNATLFKKSQNAVISGSEDDLDNLKLRLNYGLTKVWDGLRIPRLTKDKRAKAISLGYKDTSGEDVIWSHIIIRNIAEGKNTEGPAGLSAKSLIMDEIGKAPFSQAFEAAKPSMMSKFGWRAIPILVGTGGSFENGEDAERIFYHPEANNFLSFEDPETHEKTGFFMSGLYRTDCKYETNLAEYLIKEGKLIEGDYPELSKIPILVSDKVKALRKILEDRKLKAGDPDQTEYLKLIMYFPLNPKECFLSSSENFYNGDIAQEQKDKLEAQFPGLKVGMFFDLEEDVNGKVSVKPTTKVPITTFPHKPTENKDTPVVILEHPIPNPSYGLYVAGVDPYKMDEAKYSKSLGAIYIFKRMYDPQAHDFQDMPVAWYVGRPKSQNTWNNTTRLLIKYFNAEALVENDEMSFINYMIYTKHEGYYLADTPDYIKELVPNSSGNSRAKGISRAGDKTRTFLRANLKQYMEEVFTSIAVPGQVETKKLLGITKMYDPMFLEEIIKWNYDINADREVAMSLAVTHARKLDSLMLNRGPNSLEEDPRFTYSEPKRHSRLFPDIHHTSYNGTMRSLFK